MFSNKFIRFCIIVSVYGLLLSISLWLSYQLRFDFFVARDEQELAFLRQIPRVLFWVVPLKMLVMAVFRQYSGLVGYFGTPDLKRLIKAVMVGSALVGIAWLQKPVVDVPPRGVILIDFMVTAVFLCGFRISCRAFRELLYRPELASGRSEAYRVAILGAGDVGAGLAKDFLNKRGLGRVPVAFLDDDRGKWNQRIHNIPVVGRVDKIGELKEKLRIEEVVIAMPNASAKRIGEVVGELQRHHLKFVTVPSLDQMATGKVRISQLRPVEIEDLLRRDPVSIEKESISELLSGKVVLVTGAGGSIGSELCRQIAFLNPSRLLMLEQSEYLLFEIEQQLNEKGFSGIARPIIGNILDEARIEEVFARFQPNVIFHAAALKHVPMMELQPSEAVKINSIGTAMLARKAVEAGVDRFVMISTDKAINPTSVMGATKRMAEMYLKALNESGKSKTTFMAVRFGNVLGSSGSVIPTFKRQIQAGGPVKVTHPDVTRYFMTIPEAVGLVLQCGSQGNGGEIFVLDMGKPVKIVDLARNLIELSGLRPEEDIDIEFIGLRPGEKLYEELQHADENLVETAHPKILCFVSEAARIEDMEERFTEFRKVLNTSDSSTIRSMLKKVVVEYEPYVT